MPKKNDKWVTVGKIGVDAGMCWVGDPCYILHTDENPKDIGKDWGEFCDTMFEREGYNTRQRVALDARFALLKEDMELVKAGKEPLSEKEVDRRMAEATRGLKASGAAQFNYDKGHPGLGVVVNTGYGDGSYPVQVRYDKDGHVAEVRVVFIGEGE